MIAGGLAAYFNAYPTIKFVNKTISIPTQMDSAVATNADPNPARGVCLPVILKFCQNHRIPYNYTGEERASLNRLSNLTTNLFQCFPTTSVTSVSWKLKLSLSSLTPSSTCSALS